MFRNSSYVITYLPGNVLWLLKCNFQVYYANNIEWENSHPERTEETADVLSHGDFFYLWFPYLYKVFFGQSIPCIQGLNIPKAFHQSTHKKIWFWHSLTWPGFKCLTIAANHTQLSTCTTAFFFVLWFLMIPHLILLSLQTRRKGLYINTTTV